MRISHTTDDAQTIEVYSLGQFHPRDIVIEITGKILRPEGPANAGTIRFVFKDHEWEDFTKATRIFL